ncbi:cutinase family protein [Rhodococcus sp. W8901]|uniref:cutinase family protein n=1 Tax=Rhodococcus sp. W8901 TaxID=2742603 RepID=UPI001583A458|nr:cutinase family protein [Rhodococcus sp. W8901]QKT13657.1 cutinase family protein [Rhodococcus sp. W8901]
MTIRGFFARHRMAARVTTPAALGVAVVVALTWALSSPPPSTVDTQLTASTTECRDMVTVSIAGRSDTPVAGTTKMLVDPDGNELPAALSDDYSSGRIDQVINAPNGVVDRDAYAALYIAYPANMASYDDAVAAGVANTESVMRAIRVSCPDTKFSIVGYSEGADVARRVAMNIGHQEPDADQGYGIVDPSNVVGVVIFADAGRGAGQGPFPGAKNPFGNPDGFDTKYQNGKTPVPGQGVLPNTGDDDFGALGGKVASFCSDGDFTCAAPQNISLLQLVVNVGRQINVDRLEGEGLTPATGQDIAVVLGRIGYDAFLNIQSQPNWMRSDETFLDVLLKVSDPDYVPGESTTQTPKDVSSISTDEMSPLAYLPQKVFKEIVGLIVTNQNTIPVILSDPYQMTLAPDIGHHFDYWRDADGANGKPLTSAEYAAAWLTYLAKQAQNGKPVDPAAKPTATELADALTELAATTTESSAEPTGSAVPQTPTASPSESAVPSESAAQSATETTVPATSPAVASSTEVATTPTPSPAASPDAAASTSSTVATTTKPTPTTTTTPAPRPAG